eukprot:NODE_2359_length_950_cov_394.379888.p1 GENE.NODE_2359_length_950_cov_394.379888~~NODE_2359_length_950_cov_394.379888.p1  ORF type:complete len:277 (+),score=55.81 NODE_2359_length_950_cov_394.379888:3-833(+)
MGSHEAAQASSIYQEYSVSNGLSWHLRHSISQFKKHQRGKTRRRIVEGDVSYLSDLPEHLALKLHCEVFGVRLAKHPLFHKIRQVFPDTLQEMCHRCTSEEVFDLGKEVFAAGTAAEKMIFVSHGTFDYMILGHHEFSRTRTTTPDVLHSADTITSLVTDISLANGDWLCEASLWLAYPHKGVLISTAYSSVVQVNSLRWHEAVRKSPMLLRFLQTYAATFAARAGVADHGESPGMEPDCDILCLRSQLKGTAEMVLDAAHWHRLPSHGGRRSTYD